jgi:hypothetical protein
MSWLAPIIIGALEAVWATALSKSDGLSRFGPTVTFFVSIALIMVGLRVRDARPSRRRRVRGVGRHRRNADGRVRHVHRG